MSRSRRPFAGRMDVAGFLVDPAHVGAEEAHRRVLRSWVGGTRLYDLDGRLLVLLPSPTSMRAERAPGLPVVVHDGALEIALDGAVRIVRERDLTPYDLAGLVDLGDLALTTLAPAPPPPAPAVDRRPTEVRAAADVRALAGVGDADRATARRRDRMRRSRADSAGAAAARQSRGGGVLASMVLRSPARGAISRRNQRYVDDLTFAFRSGRWDTALPSAISVAGVGGGALALRLRMRRGPVTGPGSRGDTAATAVPLGGQVHEHLRELYRQAAARLEAEGDHLRAAFVHADLLGNHVDAVELLERHGHHRRAAELAEGWELPPALVVRLWWRAGERDRAARIAAVRGAYADAVLRFERVDAPGAVGLRRAWVDERRAAGDHLGAVQVAWPVADLRDDVLPDIAAGIAHGGRTAGTLLAHLLEHVVGADAAPAARALFDDPALTATRTAFVRELAERSLRDSALDRELTSRALVAVTTGTVDLPDPVRRSATDRLRRRADPLLAADLPRSGDAPPGATGTLEVDAREPGQVRTYDAVAIGDSSVLVALGELGVRLLGPDGRVRARWDVPTHRIVVADHGQRVLLVAARGERHVVHQLDLPLGRPVPLPVLDTVPLDSYDGVRPLLVSERGLEWVEREGDRWRLVWRELTEPGTQVVRVVRSPDALAALFVHGDLQAWSWSLPQVTLRQRGTVDPGADPLIVATGQVGRLEQGSGVAAVHWHAVHGQRLTTETIFSRGEVALLVSGPSYTVLERSADKLRATVHASYSEPGCAVVELAVAFVPSVRWTPGRVTVSDGTGRVLVIDTERLRLAADLSVRP